MHPVIKSLVLGLLGSLSTVAGIMLLNFAVTSRSGAFTELDQAIAISMLAIGIICFWEAIGKPWTTGPTWLSYVFVIGGILLAMISVVWGMAGLLFNWDLAAPAVSFWLGVSTWYMESSSPLMR